MKAVIAGSVDSLLNDRETEFLADVFLFDFGFERDCVGYRYLRDCIILHSYGLFSPYALYKLAAKSERVSLERFLDAIMQTLDGIKRPLHEVFDEVYAPPLLPFESERGRVVMRELDFDGTLSFLGVVFAYLLETNYPSDRRVTVIDSDG